MTQQQIIIKSSGSIMNYHTLSLYADLQATLVRVEGMKAANPQHPDNQPYTEKDFELEAKSIRNISEAARDAWQRGF